MSRPKIGVVTPVLNESKHVAGWADSARCADHMLMLDTGSSDDTVEAARSCGIEVHSAVVSPFRFDDARNMAMALIPPDIDIVIQLDADERFSEPNWRRHLDANPKHDRWSYWLDNRGKSDWGRVRRSNCVRRSGFRWEHPVHEVIKGTAATCHLDDLVIEHHPDTGKDRSYLLPMLETFAAEYPDDLRLKFYLGREYSYRNMWAMSRKVLWEYANSSSYSAEKQEALIMIADIDIDPEKFLWQAISVLPARREPWVKLARFYMTEGDWEMAKAMILVAKTKQDRSLYTTQRSAWDEEFDNLASNILDTSMEGQAQ